MKRTFQWFIEPLDDEANSKIGTLLAAMQEIDEFVGLIVNYQGRPTRVNAYRIPHKVIQYIQNSKEHQNLKMRIWVREGQNGRLKEWKFSNRKKVRST